MLPLRICYGFNNATINYIDIVIDILFGIDMIISFNTTYDATPDNLFLQAHINAVLLSYILGMHYLFMGKFLNKF